MPNVISKKIPKPLLKQLEACTSLPSLPAVALQVIELAKQPSAGTSSLASIIETDPSLSAKVLAAANSTFYTSSKLNSLQQAINLLGMDSALALALSFSLVKTSSKKQGLDLDRFWKRAVISGFLVKQLNKQLSLNFDVERVFLVAILQDIGMLALNEIQPKSYTNLYAVAKNHHQLARFESKEFGCTHAVVGYWLGKSWGLPKRFINLILKSHRQANQIKPTKINQKVLALVGLIADIWLAEDKETAMTLAFQASQDYLNLTEKNFSALLVQVEDKLPEITKLFELSLPKKLDTFKLLQEAKQLLVERNLSLMQKVAMQENQLASLNLASNRLKEQLKKDALTGIYNRQFIKDQLDKYFEICQVSGKILSVIFIDLDYFKNINDDYGHGVGDDVLKAFALTLETLTPEGCLAGRYGGEEFVILLPNYNLDTTHKFALRLQEHLAANALITYKKEDIYLSASIGLAEFDPAKDNSFAKPDDLVNAADQAMYDAKRKGRNRILLYTSEGYQELSNSG